MTRTATALLVDPDGAAGKRLKAVFNAALPLVTEPVPPSMALQSVRTFEPQLVVIDVGPSSTELLGVVERIMADAPRPIVLLTHSAGARQAAFALLAAGALEVISVAEHPDAAALRRQLLLLSSVRVVRHPRGRKRRTSASLPAVRPDYFVVAIAASLGGPRALAEVLSDLPRNLPAPVVICQHISAGFSGDLARWLSAETGHTVHEARDGQRLVKSEIFVSPSHQHLLVKPSGVVQLDDGAPVGGFKPSCDLLLRSVAQSFGSKAIGVVLTGMGKDGARGLKDIRDAGGHTIAQDEATSVVFGMPKEAIALGAAEQTLPLEAIGEQLVEWLS